MKNGSGNRVQSKPAHADFLSGAFFLKGFSPIAPPASEAPLLPEAYFFSRLRLPASAPKTNTPAIARIPPQGLHFTDKRRHSRALSGFQKNRWVWTIPTHEQFN